MKEWVYDPDWVGDDEGRLQKLAWERESSFWWVYNYRLFVVGL